MEGYSRGIFRLCVVGVYVGLVVGSANFVYTHCSPEPCLAIIYIIKVPSNSVCTCYPRSRFRFEFGCILLLVHYFLSLRGGMLPIESLGLKGIVQCSLDTCWDLDAIFIIFLCLSYFRSLFQCCRFIIYYFIYFEWYRFGW